LTTSAKKNADHEGRVDASFPDKSEGGKKTPLQKRPSVGEEAAAGGDYIFHLPADEKRQRVGKGKIARTSRIRKLGVKW